MLPSSCSTLCTYNQIGFANFTYPLLLVDVSSILYSSNPFAEFNSYIPKLVILPSLLVVYCSPFTEISTFANPFELCNIHQF